MTRPFKTVRTLQPKRSVFDLSYNKLFTCDMGQLIPVMCEEVVPGDFLKIGCQSVLRFMPLVAPPLHPVDVYYHVFFVPYRIMWDSWETFITGGIDGDDETPIPVWDPTESGVGSLWDYFGFPVDVDPGLGCRPLRFPMYAYNKVFNEYYRDENLQDEVDLTNELILNRNYSKDYFTSALLNQQRGTAPALPISGTTSAVWTTGTVRDDDFPGTVNVWTAGLLPEIAVNSPTGQTNLLAALNANTVDLSLASTFDISDLRLAFQVQKWQERNNRTGVRYTEFLESHFKVSPRDERLQRPEYIGGYRAPVIFSEVLQTSATEEAQPIGQIAGHGITVADGYCGDYKVHEFGLVIGIMSIMPKPAYFGQGFNKQWLRHTRYDFYFPEFANLSEQAILNNEICAVDGDPEHNLGIFGYQGRYDEMRVKQSMVCGQMRTLFDYWHLAREFDPASPPLLNEDFIQCNPEDTKRIFAVQSDPGILVNWGNLIKAFRPLPISAEPGLIDHA